MLKIELSRKGSITKLGLDFSNSGLTSEGAINTMAAQVEQLLDRFREAGVEVDPGRAEQIMSAAVLQVYCGGCRAVGEHQANGWVYEGNLDFCPDYQANGRMSEVLGATA